MVFAVFMSAVGVYSGEVLNDVIAVVGTKPITQVDLDEELKQIKRDKTFQRDRRNLKSQALDRLIHRQIIEQVLEEESINITESQIDSYIEKEMKASGVKSLAAFERALRSQRGVTLKQYRAVIYERIQIQNLVQLRISVNIPTEKQVERWYKQNRSKLGKKYKVRIIRMRYNPKNLQNELKVSKKMKEARVLALRNFPAAAKKYSDHPSKKGGGYLGWYLPHEFVKVMNQEVAQVLFQVKPGTLSQVFVSNNAYYLLKVERAVFPALDDVRELAINYLYMENQNAAYNLWLREERKKRALQIFMKDYRKP